MPRWSAEGEEAAAAPMVAVRDGNPFSRWAKRADFDSSG